MRALTGFFESIDKRTTLRLVDLYQRVQYVSFVLPRLYLMCSVGAVFVVHDKQSAKEVLRDMLAMMHGVQHPTRGLFLRHYLNQVTRGKLGVLGNAQARCQYLLQNFDEMTKLWVRMGHQDSGKGPETREAERRQLKQLVGANVTRLVEETEEGVDEGTYDSTVLPGLIKVVETCADAFAQTYLLEVATQVVPNDLQLRTLDGFLACATSDRLAAGVDVRLVLVSLMNRLCAEPALNYDSFQNAVARCARKVVMSEALEMYAALAKVAMGTSVASSPQADGPPHALARVDSIMRQVADLVAEQTASAVKLSAKDESVVVDLLMLPLKLDSTRDLLALKSFAQLTLELSPDSQTRVASKVVQAVTDAEEGLASSDVAAFFAAVPSAIKAHPALVAKALFRIGGDAERAEALAALRVAQSHVGSDPVLLPALLARILAVGANDAGALQAAHEVCSSLAARDEPQSKLKAARCFLLAFQAADKAQQSAQADEFMVQALTLLEETPDSRAQAALLPCVVGALQRSTALPAEALEGFMQKTAIQAAGLLRKPDQVRAILLSAHLFWTVEPVRAPGRNAKRALECLQRALKVADLTPPAEQLALFVDILNAYVFFLRAGADKIKPAHVSGLITVMRDKAKASPDARSVAHFASSLEFLRGLQASPESAGPLREVVVGGPVV